MNYYNFLNEKFDKMLLTEEQQVVINFKNIFGADTYELFKTKKARLRNPENDVSYWVRQANEDRETAIRKLNDLLGSSKVNVRDVEGRVLPEPANTKQVVAENDDYIVYFVDDVTDMMALAMEKNADDYAGAYWCIAGRYGLGSEDGEDRDELIKISQAEYYFDSYLEDSYNAYFVCMPKNDECQKHCLCFINETTCEDWNSDDERNMMDEDFYRIPEFEFNGFRFEGENSVRGEDPEDEVVDDEEGERAPAETPAFVNIDIEDPNSMEFPASSKEEAASKFKSGAEVVETIREPDLHIVKWHEEPEPRPEDAGEDYVEDTGDRYTLFVFIPGEGGGPLLAQTGHGFALQVFKDLEKLRQFAGRMPGVEIRNNRNDTEDMPECLRENFNYYNDNSWFYEE